MNAPRRTRRSTERREDRDRAAVAGPATTRTGPRPPTRMAAFRIVLLGVAAAVCYGVVHDQITARLCIEYFTVAHPRLVATDDPTVHALLWGILGTWWVGAVLGGLLAFAAQAGDRPKREAASLVRGIVILLGIMGASAALAGVVAYVEARAGHIIVLEPLASRIPEQNHHGFIVALWMHLASYGVGFVGGLVLACRVWRSRQREAESSLIAPA
jgi:hypothetical protein